MNDLGFAFRQLLKNPDFAAGRRVYARVGHRRHGFSVERTATPLGSWGVRENLLATLAADRAFPAAVAILVGGSTSPCA